VTLPDEEGTAVTRGERAKARAEEPPCEKVRLDDPEAKCTYDCPECGERP